MGARRGESVSTSRPLCHEAPDLLEFEATVLDTRPCMVRLSRSAFYPGGGGQPADRGTLEWSGGVARVTGFDTPYPHSLEWAYFPGPVRIGRALERLLKD